MLLYLTEKQFTGHNLSDLPLPHKTYGGKVIKSLVKQQIESAMHLSVFVSGCRMPIADYVLLIGGVLIVENADIHYAIGVGMSLAVFDVKADFKTLSHQIKEVLKVNHFVEFREIGLVENNSFNLPSRNYMSLLSRSSSRGMRVTITNANNNHNFTWGNYSTRYAIV